jgi:hypothetical protein
MVHREVEAELFDLVVERDLLGQHLVIGARRPVRTTEDGG